MATGAPNFQLELMNHDKVMQESFQKLQLWICDDSTGLIALIRDLISATSTPGFTYGRSGNNVPGSFLLNDTVPSNKTGRPVPIDLGALAKVSIAQEDAAASRFTVVEHDGNLAAQRDVVTVDMAGSVQRVFDFTGTPLPVTPGRQLALRVDFLSSRNCDVGLTLLGEL